MEELIANSSEALGGNITKSPAFLADYELGRELFQLLTVKNGFFAFESALHVFPITADPLSGLEGWNASTLWRASYQDLTVGLLFFAEDVFQDQFCLSNRDAAVFRFHAETGETKLMARSIEEWADSILSTFREETGFTLAQEWQRQNGPLKPGQRLMPKIPFFLGGEYAIQNLWAGNPLEGLRYKGDLAMQTRDMPNGTKVRLRVSRRPEH